MKAAILATALACAWAASADAKCSGNPYDKNCSPADFVNPLMTDQNWWQQSTVTRQATVTECLHPKPGVKPLPAAWCRAAIAAEAGRH